jgi:hypothetical protein
MDEKPADSARVQRIVRAPVDCTAQRSPFLLLGPASNSFMFFSKAMRANVRVDAAGDNHVTDKLSMRSPLIPLASNELLCRSFEIGFNPQ